MSTQTGAEHDLDDLSSGEKEILYGYLRIRSSAPQDSIILLDEPELHLNPRLIRGLPEFYRKHLGEALQNQLWLVTHSDALIREAVGKPGFNVFHMLPCGADSSSKSQLRPLTVTKDLELVLTDLVGDLAAYRPGGKGLIFEGGGDSDFDKTLSARLFSEELRGINLISGTNKVRVKALHDILNRAYDSGDFPTKFFAIVDKDSDPGEPGAKINRFSWDVYHIENYLLVSEFIADVLNSLDLSKKWSAALVDEYLVDAARTVFPAVVSHRMRGHVNSIIVNCIDLGFSNKSDQVGGELHLASQRSVGRLQTALGTSLSNDELIELERVIRAEMDLSIVDGTWRSILPGREILKKFIAANGPGIAYEIFRNLIVDRMVSANYRPAGMAKIVDMVKCV